MATRFMPRSFGGSFYFNSSQRLISASAIFDPSATNFSVSVWVKFKLPNSGALQVLFGQQNGTGTGRSWLQVSSAGLLQTVLGGVAKNGATTFVPGVWYMLTVTKTGTTVTLYVNSVQDSTFTVTTEAASGAAEIGQDKANANGAISYICDVQIYNLLLTQAQITALYFRGTQPSTPYIWYKLNDGQGATAVDSGSQANNGTMTGTNWSLDVPFSARLPMRDFGTSLFTPPANTSFAFSTGADFNPAGSFSFGGWVKTDSVSTTKIVMGKGAATGGQTNYAYSMVFASPNLTMRVSKDGTTATTFTPTIALHLMDGRWHHIAMSYQFVADGTSIGIIYVDGQIIAKNSVLPGPIFATSTADFVVGTGVIGATGHGSPSNPVIGNVDEAFFYNAVMTQAQIQDLLAYGKGSTLVPMNDTNLYGFWTFDEGAGTTAADSSNRGNNLTLNSTAGWSTIVPSRSRQTVVGVGSSLFFEGTTARLALASNIGFLTTDSITIMAWIKTQKNLGSGGFATIFGTGNGTNNTYTFGVRTSSGGNLQPSFLLRNTGTSNSLIPASNSSAGNLGDGIWHHIAAVFIGGSTTMRIYIDGVLVGQSTAIAGTGDFNRNQVPNIGATPIGPADFFTGLIDEVAFIPSALTTAQILSIALNQNFPSNFSPSGYWKMDENSGTTVVDSSGNANTATLTGANLPLWSNDVGMKIRSSASGRSTI